MAEIAVIVPAYNASAYLGETIDSVRRQSFEDWELIVVNDGSRDSTAAVARRYLAEDARIRLIEQTNAGVAAARNRGLADVDRAAWAVMFLDADDLLDSHALERLLT